MAACRPRFSSTSSQASGDGQLLNLGTDDVDAGMTVVTSLLWQMADVSDARLTRANGGRLTARGVRHCLPSQAGAPPFLPPSRVWSEPRSCVCQSVGPQKKVHKISEMCPIWVQKTVLKLNAFRVQGSGFTTRFGKPFC